MDSYTSYCNAVAEHTTPEALGEGDVTLEMAKGDAGSSRSSLDDGLEADKPEVSTLFQFLQILTACFGSFAHGGNDVRYADSFLKMIFFFSVIKPMIKKKNCIQLSAAQCCVISPEARVLLLLVIRLMDDIFTK